MATEDDDLRPRADAPRHDRALRPERAVNCDAVEAYLKKVLVRELRHGDIVIMDNLSRHKGPRARQLIEAAEARLLFLTPYSPDFNPIENAFARLKALRKPAERTVDGLCDAIGQIAAIFSPPRLRQLLRRRRLRSRLIGLRSS